MTRVAAPTWRDPAWGSSGAAGPGDAQGARGDHLARDRLLVALKAAGLLASLGAARAGLAALAHNVDDLQNLCDLARRVPQATQPPG